MINLTHPFKDKCPDIKELSTTQNGSPISTINGFCRRLESLSSKYLALITPNNFKGWGLELLVEYIIKDCGSDNRIGIYDYNPDFDDSLTKDVGVDGHGIGENGRPATVQVKFRQANYVLTANEDHLSNFLTSSWFDYKVNLDDDKNMLIVTTGQAVNPMTMSDMLKGKVRQLNRQQLRQMFDNRPQWWKRFFKSAMDSRCKVSPSPIFKKLSLRAHQKKAVQLVFEDDNMKGMVILPTGTGKTIVEAEVVREMIGSLRKKGIDSPLFKVNSSRILLCFQLFEEFYKYLSSFGIDACYANFNSGNKSDNEYAEAVRKQGGIYREIVSTTSPDVMVETYEKCKKSGIPLLVFSTYHSADKFAESGLTPNLTIHDEAHNLVSDSFINASMLPSGGNLFFTATMRTSDSDDGIGMNNPELFDNIIYSKSASSLIEAGEMVPPYVHVVKTLDAEEVGRSDYDSMFKSIADSFFAHERKIKQHSAEPNKIGAKTLVVCRNQQDLIEMFDSKALERFKRRYPEIYLFALSSDFGMYNDGEFLSPPVTNMKKHALIQKLKKLEYHEKCIIFHVDMIGEGIDVPGITGVMPFRNLELTKFVQNVGRSTRLHPIDREKFYAGKISTSNREDYVKPCSWIIIPTFLADSKTYSGRFMDILERVRVEFGYVPTQVTHLDENGGLIEDEDIDTVNEVKNGSRNDGKGVFAFGHEFDHLDWATKLASQQASSKKVKSIVHGLLNNT